MLIKVKKALESDDEQESLCALEIFGCLLSTSDPSNTDLILFHGLLDSLGRLINTSLSFKNLKTLLWCLSNITAGTKNQIMEVLRNETIVQRVFVLMDYSNREIVREALYVLTNLIYSCEDSSAILSVVYFEEFQLFRVFVKVLKVMDVGVIMEILSCLDILFKLDKELKLSGSQQMAYKFEELGGVEVLDELQKHPNLKVYEAVEKLIKDHMWDGEE